jgi:hypothetical protein
VSEEIRKARLSTAHQNGDKVKITCNIRVNRASYPQLEAAQDAFLRQDTLWEGSCISGLPHGKIYIPSDRMLTDQQGLDGHTLRLGSLVLDAELAHLPSLGQAAVVAASPEYRQYAVAPLLILLRGTLGPAAQQRWWSEMEDVIAQGAQPGLPLQTALPGPVPARWLREETRLVQRAHGSQGRHEWFAVLAFELAARQQPVETRPGSGIDLGLVTLATAAMGETMVTAPRAAAPDWKHAPVRRGSPVHRMLYDGLQYAVARTSLEALGHQLMAGAGFVATEQLDLHSFRGRFPQQARRLALLDWCWSTLPQLLHAHGIPLVRVDPRDTSRECHLCHSCHPDQRRKRRFSCRACGIVMDADLNAARVIAQRGAAVLDRRRS